MPATATRSARFPVPATLTQKKPPSKGRLGFCGGNAAGYLRRREITSPAAPKTTSARDVGSGVGVGDRVRLLKVMS